MNLTLAGVAELADATDSKSVSSKGVWVRPPPPVGFQQKELSIFFLGPALPL